jgi:Pili and flagellar-assembly chaperone, PapD N-terminal domain
MPINVQICVFRWSQRNGIDALERTSDVVASPPAARVAPGVPHTVRVVRVAKGKPAAEQAYRVIIDELPDPRALQPDTVRLVLRYSIPVFFSPAKANPGGASARLSYGGGQFRLQVANDGPTRLKIADVAFRDSALEARVFGRIGLLRQTATVSRTSSGGSGFVRLDTTFSRSNPASLVTYRAGDLVSRGFEWTRPVRLGGVQVGRDFTRRPDLVTMPLPSYADTAAVPSTVDVFAGGAKVYSTKVTSGPFSIADLPIVSGAGTARIVRRGQPVEAPQLGGRGEPRQVGPCRDDAAGGAVKTTGGQLQPEEASPLHRTRHMEAVGRIGREAEARVVLRIADQDHRRVAKQLGAVERHLHQPGADALATEMRFDRQRAEEQGRPVAGAHVPEAERTAERIAVAGDERQTRSGQTALAQTLGGLGSPIRHHPVEQGFPGAEVARRLIVYEDHRRRLRSRRI